MNTRATPYISALMSSAAGPNNGKKRKSTEQQPPAAPQQNTTAVRGEEDASSGGAMAVVVAAPKRDVMQERMTKIVRQSYLGPLTSEHVNSNAVHVMAHAFLEYMHKTMETDVAEGKSEMEWREASHKAVDLKIEEMMKSVRTTADGRQGLTMLKRMITAELEGTLQENFSVLPVEFKNGDGSEVQIGEILFVQEEEDEDNNTGTEGLMFKILRKICGIVCAYQRLLKVENADMVSVNEKAAVRIKSQIKSDLHRMMQNNEKTAGRLKELSVETERMTLEIAEVEKKMGDMDSHDALVNEKAIEMKRKIEETMRVFSEMVEDGDAERGMVVECKATMMRSMENIMNDVIGKKKKAKKQELADEVKDMKEALKVKMEEIDRVKENGVEDKSSKDAYKKMLEDHYTKLQNVVCVMHCKAYIQDLMSLGEVLQEVRLHLHKKTQKAFRRIVAAPPPPPSSQ